MLRVAENVLDARRAEQERRRRPSRVDAADRVLPRRRVLDPLVSEPVDHLDVELALRTDRELGPPVLVDHDRGPVVGDAAELVERAARIVLPVVAELEEGRLRIRAEHAVRREDRQPRLRSGDDDGHQPRALLGTVLLVERERGLVAVVAVRDQELRVREPIDEGLVAHAPQPARDAALGRLEVRLAGVPRSERSRKEQEDRLELRAHGAEQAQAALLRSCVSALVRQDDAVLVRLDMQ